MVGVSRMPLLLATNISIVKARGRSSAQEHPLLAMARWVHASTPHSRLLNSRQQWSTDRHYAARYYPPFYGASGDTCARGWYLVTRIGIRYGYAGETLENRGTADVFKCLKKGKIIIVIFEFCEKLILDFKGGLKVFKGVIRERRINIRVFFLSFSGNKWNFIINILHYTQQND